MSFTVLIPARLASTRLPDKPLADIGGLPMVVRVAQRAERSGAAQVVVAADSRRIADACSAHGVRAVLTREDHPSGSDRLAEACEQLGLEGDDVVVNVQGDEPLIDISSVDALIAKLETSPVGIATLACPLETDEEFQARDVVKVVIDSIGNALYFSRAPIGSRETALRHIGVYAYRRAAIDRFVSLAPSPLERAESLEQLRALQHGLRIAVSKTGKPHLGVDRPEDVARVEHELTKLQP